MQHASDLLRQHLPAVDSFNIVNPWWILTFAPSTHKQTKPLSASVPATPPVSQMVPSSFSRAHGAGHSRMISIPHMSSPVMRNTIVVIGDHVRSRAISRKYRGSFKVIATSSSRNRTSHRHRIVNEIAMEARENSFAQQAALTAILRDILLGQKATHLPSYQHRVINHAAWALCELFDAGRDAVG